MKMFNEKMFSLKNIFVVCLSCGRLMLNQIFMKTLIGSLGLVSM